VKGAFVGVKSQACLARYQRPRSSVVHSRVGWLAGGRKNRLTNVAGLLALALLLLLMRLVTTRTQPGYACEPIGAGRAVQTIGIGGLRVGCCR